GLHVCQTWFAGVNSLLGVGQGCKDSRVLRMNWAFARKNCKAVAQKTKLRRLALRPSCPTITRHGSRVFDPVSGVRRGERASAVSVIERSFSRAALSCTAALVYR